MSKARGAGIGIGIFFLIVLIIGGLLYYSYSQIHVELNDVSYHSIDWTNFTLVEHISRRDLGKFPNTNPLYMADIYHDFTGDEALGSFFTHCSRARNLLREVYIGELEKNLKSNEGREFFEMYRSVI